MLSRFKSSKLPHIGGILGTVISEGMGWRQGLFGYRSEIVGPRGIQRSNLGLETRWRVYGFCENISV